MTTRRWNQGRGIAFDESTAAGHELRIVERGRLRIESRDRTWEARAGAVMWFCDHEPVRGRVRESPCALHVLRFTAPTLPPPAFDRQFQRVRPAEIVARLHHLHRAWKNTRARPTIRALAIHALLQEILAAVVTPEQLAARVGRQAALWWQVEAELRQDLQRATDPKTISQIGGSTPAMIARSCRYATGISPSKRVKQLRMRQARGLVWMSDLSFTTIAERVGFARVHEFSRDYRKHFGVTPTRDRERFFAQR